MGPAGTRRESIPGGSRAASLLHTVPSGPNTSSSLASFSLTPPANSTLRPSHAFRRVERLEGDARSVSALGLPGTVGAMDGGDELQGRTRACPGKSQRRYRPSTFTAQQNHKENQNGNSRSDNLLTTPGINRFARYIPQASGDTGCTATFFRTASSTTSATCSAV